MKKDDKLQFGAKLLLLKIQEGLKLEKTRERYKVVDSGNYFLSYYRVLDDLNEVIKLLFYAAHF
jgi:hypothetical protein